MNDREEKKLTDGDNTPGEQEEQADSGTEAEEETVVGDSSAEPAGNADEGDEADVDQSTPVAGVSFPDGKVIEFDHHKLKLQSGDLVVVDNDRDLNLGRVVFLTRREKSDSLRRVMRRIGPEDMLLIRRNKKREEEAFHLCEKLIAEHGLPMKLIRVAYLHGGNKGIFYFAAEGRIDFRALVRDLARLLHVRIEMRQIGVRDESKMLGGVGICGQQLCCSRFLHKFVPVSIKMAKNQNLALNPQKLSGLCGRLMCCLVYEDKTYRQQRKLLPKVGAVIDTPGGPGKVIDLDIPGCRARIQLQDRVVIYTVAELAGKAETKVEAEPAESFRKPARDNKAKEPRQRQRSKDKRRRKKEDSRQTGRGKKSAGTDQATGQSGKKDEKAKTGDDKSGKKKRKRRSRRRSKRRRSRSKREDKSGSGSGGSDKGARQQKPGGEG